MYNTYMNDKPGRAPAGLFSLLHTAGAAQAHVESKLAAVDLSLAKLAALSVLRDAGESLPLSQLGRQLQIHQTSITSLVDRLEKQGLIKRTPHPTDRRSTIAQMTPSGRDLLREAIKLLNSELYRDLGLTGNEARLLIGLLMKMRSSWNDIENPAGWEPFEVGQDSLLAD